MTERKITYADRQRADGKFPAVLRCASMRPQDAFGMIAHGEREIGNLDHCDPTRKHLNRTLIGSKETAVELVQQMRDLADFNLRSNIAGLAAMGRKKDLARVKRNGIQDPWSLQKKANGPLREVVLTVHRDFFRADDDTPSDMFMTFLNDEGEIACFDMRKIDRLVDASREFLVGQFGDALVYLRADLDEQSIHLQGIISDVVEEKKSLRYAHGRKLFRTTHHPLIGGILGDPRRGYEIAQDTVAAFFAQPEHADMNIVRGEARAAAVREAMTKAAEESKAVEVADFFGEDVSQVPAGSANAQAMFLLKRKMAEAVDLKARPDDMSKLAVEYLELIGAISPQEAQETSTRRARKALLEAHEGTYGTVAEIVAAPDLAAAKALRLALATIASENRVAAVERARLDALAVNERAEKAAADEARREKKFAAKEATLEASMRAEQEDRDRAHQRRVDDFARRHQERIAAAEAVEKANAEKAAVVTAAAKKLQADREAVAKREVEVERKIGWLNETSKHMQVLGDQIRAAAIRLDLMKDPIVELSMKAVNRIKSFAGYDRTD